MKQLKNEAESRQSCVSVSVTDLRIGNLVELDNKESWLSFANLPMTVTEIDSKLSQKEKEVWDKSDGTISLKYKYETFNQFSQFIKPIPLTDKLLLELGFIEVDYAGGCYQKEDITIDIADFNCCYKKDWLEIDVKYLHKLQNLYHALIGSELQIGSLTEH